MQGDMNNNIIWLLRGGECGGPHVGHGHVVVFMSYVMVLVRSMVHG